jgi:hypothetical protein|tara:strand:+ start:1202 stop:1435 length:234 start_codon:yes stop_codon:yes gene_type:complete
MGWKINIDKAKKITKEKLRIDRYPLLQEEDIKFQKALEKNEDISAIATEKQRLRDITKQVDSMKTLEELKKATVNNA